eukprot:TRINITY_DN11824_c0_g1_i1.p2 TRINITY_DN11824_c0_g1~~TRINITY_DN11824_c0_g1_i1.p2  ORF type:complete len:152 (+),score=22.31 TRINITY_DN11824_c0_g1_i1:432-887(+)
MPRCGCGRSFENQEKLARHASSCKHTATAEQNKTAAGPSSPARHGGGPRVLTCYVCGTQHGLSSLGIHQRQCIGKREKEQELLPREQRTPLPSAPSCEVPGPKASSAEVDAYNAAAQSAYENTMPRCGCGRSFENQEKLARHASSCKHNKQ